jgi:vitamin K-dependent gamma-carboxylase
MINRFLFRQIDNSALIIFRVFFGLLIFLESVGAILTGWVNRVFIAPEFTFSFIGFEWLQPLPDYWMYVYYIVMGIFGLFIMLGFKYRLSIIGFTIMWIVTYLMQKSSYNNHYYLLILLSAFMVFMPANTYFSVDAKIKPSIKKNAMPQWCSLIFILQMGIVYTYASIAKMYPDWLDTTVVEILMKSKEHYYLIGNILQQKWVHYFIAYSGLFFDLLVVPLLLWKPTRKYAFFASIFFHLFNSIVFQVGVFPYLSLAISVFFFEPETIRNIFFKKKEPYRDNEIIIPKRNTVIVSVLIIYFSIQIVLPLRHWVIKDDVLWTEEGHRMSWRMMLRSRGGIAKYKVIDKSNNTEIPIHLNNYLSKKQLRVVSVRPDVIWQFAQYLKRNFKAKGKNVEVYVDCSVSVNGKPLKRLINPKVDLAAVKWNAFKHSEWILSSKQD